MTAYIIRRVLWMFPLLFAVATVTFILMHLTPGGPFSEQEKLPEATREALARTYNLDKPIHEQYLYYLGDISPITYEPPFFKSPDLGESFSQRGRSVREIIGDGLWVSAQLGVISFIFAITLGMSLGVISALNHNKILDYVGVLVATIGAAVPSFVLATLLAWLFSVELGWTDRLGWELGNFRKMTLPVVALGMLPAAFIARITRASMLEVLQQDFIRTARSKGLAEWVVIMRHVVKNSLIPVLTVSGPIFAVLVTGSFIIEGLFQINGIGRPFVTAVFRRDYGVIMGTTLVYASLVAVANLIVDILYATVDPRIRYS